MKKIIFNLILIIFSFYQICFSQSAGQAFSVLIKSDKDSICKGNQVKLSVILSNSNPINKYKWSDTTLSGSSVITPVLNSTTTYSLTVTDNSGNTASGSITIKVISPNAEAGNDVNICKGQSAILTATGGNTYLWSNTGKTSVITVTPTTQTTYSVTVTDISGCTASDNVTVFVHALPVTTATGGTVCKGSTITINASGADNYSWSNGMNGSNITINPTITTTYKVTGTTIYNCSNTAQAIVTVNSLPSVTSNGGAICIGKSFVISASGASTFTWNNGLGSGYTKTVSPTTTTTYTVTGVNSNNCSNTANVIVIVNPLPIVLVSGGTMCAGSSITLNASGANTYTWSSGLGNGISKAVNPTKTITYTVTGTDVNSCSNTTNSIITVNPLPVIKASNIIVCVGSGNSITLTAGGAVSYSWSNGLGNGNSKIVSLTTSTTFTVTGTDANNCSDTANAIVNINLLPHTKGTGGTICTGNTITLTAGGASTYTWSNGLGTGNTKTVSPTTTTTYLLTGTDTYNCASVINVLVTVEPLPIVTVSSGAVCSGNSITLNAQGASTYLWSNGLGSGYSINVQPTINTTYTVTGTNIYNCTNTANTFVKVYVQPNAGFYFDFKNSNTYAGDTILFHPLLENDSSNYSFHWDFGDGNSSNSATPLHTYKDKGSKGIKLNVSNICGTDSSLQFITIFNHQSPTKLNFENIAGPWNSDSTDSWSAVWMDYNNDGWEDIFVTDKSGSQPGILYKNLGNGNFAKVLAGDITKDKAMSVSSVWADVNNDGNLDAVIINDSQKPNMLYLNDGNGNLERYSNSGISDSIGFFHSGAWVDYDNDGLLDFFSENYLSYRFNELLHQTPDGKFSRIPFTKFYNISNNAIGAAWADYDNDGYQDVFMPQGDGQHNKLYKNLGNGTFEEIINIPPVNEGGTSVASCWGDYDNDGLLDLFVSNASNNCNYLYHNDGNGNFTKITNSPVVSDTGHAHGCSWVDVDNDGYLDLYVSDGAGVQRLYMNNKHGNFTRLLGDTIVSVLPNSFSHAWADYDKDGYLDLFVASHGKEKNYLFHNNQKGNHWINIKLIGTVSNRSAIGTRIKIKAGGIWQIREVNSQSGFCSQNSLRQHFGLGQATIIDSIVISWSSGIKQYITKVYADQFITFTEINSVEVSGKVFSDIDADCIYSTQEPSINNLNLIITPGPIYTATDNNGNFNLHLLPGNYTINIDNNNEYWQNKCGPVFIQIPQNNYNPIENLNIPLTPKKLASDMSISAANTHFRRGFKGVISMEYSNIGTIEAPDVYLVLDKSNESDVHIITSTFPIYEQNDPIYKWHLGSIMPGQSGLINLTDSVDLNAVIGSTVQISLHFEGNLGNETNTENNSSTISSTLVGSIDPNEITVSPVGEGTQGYIGKKDTLTYTIYFQNVGNYPAENIYINDKLPDGLDISSFKYISSSHNCQYQIQKDGTISFTFENINLPDSLTNEATSTGFVQFSIMPLIDVSNETALRNNAEIQFDYEDKMPTNKVLNTIRTFDFAKLNELVIYPNPVQSACNITIPLHIIKKYELNDMSGNLIYSVDQLNNKVVLFDTKNLSDGIYQVSGIDESGKKYYGKMIIIK